MAMDYYREVMTDDPFRRSERENPSDSAADNRKGDLFGLRQRARQLCVLVDRESLQPPSNDSERETHQILDSLLTRYDPVETLFVDMSRINEPDDGSDRTPNVVHLRDYSDQQGWASLPGPAFGYRICFQRGSTREVNGNLHPGPQLVQNLMEFAGNGGPHLAELPAEDLRKHVILTEAGRKVADLVISESAAASRKDIQANYDANVFSRAEAIPIIAHYLRTQQIYLLSPLWNQVSNRKTFYHSAVYAMLPSIGYWEAKARCAIDTRYVDDTQQMVGRLIRALKAFDDLRFHLGALQTTDSYDDAADCVDRILWSLCGAVDVAARSLHVALKIAGPSRNAKFQGEWYEKRFRPVYSAAVGIENVDCVQAALATVYKLRNTVHSHALSAAGASTAPTRYVGKERGRVRLLIPHDVYEEIAPADRGKWGFEHAAPGRLLPATADLATVAATAVDAVFSFIDQLHWMISFESVQDRHDVLKLNSFSVIRDDQELPTLIRKMIGFATASGSMGTPYSV
jgi:hypothetical protein